ncbi:aminoglycoside/choline kinase family phosphotransferase [Hydrogenophaga palleronii]|uniref:Aminoglycoside/choline kinase family phosphotransferase n=1 Tax=Hydrogenophaga palleronii TaxID=65655 RepID=A0ABU1WV43_9BURK|nr:phosphotransferase [Hydrogenophaga palleronii]MDR7153177.1 aminoglycoside/choline kinase family phosphotransferase [Hydrogenophaga palleronii]
MPPTEAVSWSDAQRKSRFDHWLAALPAELGLLPGTLRPASADASFRRYLRIDSSAGTSCIVMDAPPEHENCRPFVQVAQLMRDAGLLVPDILAWDEPQGFMLLSDLGHQTLLDVIDPADPQAHHAQYMAALDSLLAWQLASRPGVLPPYDEALLRRELQLFPDWYLQKHKSFELGADQAQTLHKAFDSIVKRNLAAPSVYVHRDFMPRNLMIPKGIVHPHAPPLRGSLPPEGADSPWGGPAANRSGPAQQLGVLDFQDAVYGPITYDVASLMRDAFLTWEEDFVIDVTVRYWEKARKAGLMDFEDWHSDFGAFYRAVEWMGLQRHLKVAGIFARLTLRDGKPKYLADAPRFIHYIRNTTHRYRELGPFLKLIDQVEGLEAASGFAFGRL